jgi:hypothetical protein
MFVSCDSKLWFDIKKKVYKFLAIILWAMVDYQESLALKQSKEVCENFRESQAWIDFHKKNYKHLTIIVLVRMHYHESKHCIFK